MIELLLIFNIIVILFIVIGLGTIALYIDCSIKHILQDKATRKNIIGLFILMNMLFAISLLFN